MKQEGFIESCIASGLSTSQIVFRHIIPNLKTVVRPLFLFGLASVILTESGLSFLGLGMGLLQLLWAACLLRQRKYGCMVADVVSGCISVCHNPQFIQLRKSKQSLR
ncbi:MAG: ABC transporter permease subunit [Bacteroidia bacterium]